MAMPKMVRQQIQWYNVNDSLDNLIVRMTEDKKFYKNKGWTNLTLSLEEQDYSDARSVFLYGEFMETSKEAEKREAEENEYKENQERYEREQFERLSKKFAK